MSGLTKRTYPKNPLDPDIFRYQYRQSMLNHLGFTTLPLDEALLIMFEVQEEVVSEAKKHNTFDDYWLSL